MYRIGIVGHTPEYARDVGALESVVHRTLDLVHYQYGEESVFNLAGDTGVAEWAADACVEIRAKYHLFLPFPPDDMRFLWLDEQHDKLQLHYNSAWATSIMSQKYDKATELATRLENYRNIVDHSQFILCFWNGMKQGTTFETIKYALDNNTLVINASDDRKMVTGEDLIRA